MPTRQPVRRSPYRISPKFFVPIGVRRKDAAMAIDLCNKSPGSLAERDPGSWDDAVPSGSVLLDDLGSDQRDALNFAYRTTLSNVDPRFVAGDPAAWASDFGYALDRV